ncbi:hypothetical protein Tco_1438021 [Tanacetum coccineum]
MEVSCSFKDLSDIGSLGVVVYGYDGLPMHPLSPDYVPGPEHPPSPVYVPYVSEPVYPKVMPPEDDVLLAEEQPLPATVSPTADSPGYITESDPEEDLKEDEDDEDLEEDPTDYPTDRDDEEEESSSDDVDDKEEDEDKDEEEKEEHLAPANSDPPPTHQTPPLLPIPLPTSSPPLFLPSTNCREDVLEVTLPPQKRLCIALGPRYEIRESSSTLTARPTRGFRENYGFVSTMDAKIRRDLDREIDTDKIYRRLDDAQDNRLLIGAPMLAWLDLWRLRPELLVRLRPQTTGTACRGTDSTKDTADSDGSTIESAETC